MSIPHSAANQIIELQSGSASAVSKTTTLAKTADLELIRLVLPVGKEIPIHKAPGEITVQCLNGRVAFTASGRTQELIAGQLLFLAAAEPHSLKAVEDSVLLVTLLLGKNKSS